MRRWRWCRPSRAGPGTAGARRRAADRGGGRAHRGGAPAPAGSRAHAHRGGRVPLGRHCSSWTVSWPAVAHSTAARARWNAAHAGRRGPGLPTRGDHVHHAGPPARIELTRARGHVSSMGQAASPATLLRPGPPRTTTCETRGRDGHPEAAHAAPRCAARPVSPCVTMAAGGARSRQRGTPRGPAPMARPTRPTSTSGWATRPTGPATSAPRSSTTSRPIGWCPTTTWCSTSRGRTSGSSHVPGGVPLLRLRARRRDRRGGAHAHRGRAHGAGRTVWR
jgi:hypothetical protein